jgi:hypothetical protein
LTSWDLHQLLTPTFDKFSKRTLGLIVLITATMEENNNYLLENHTNHSTPKIEKTFFFVLKSLNSAHCPFIR